jgi:hypothetical protein
MAFENLKPSQFAPSVPISDDDIFPRSVYVSPGVYTDNMTSILDIKARIAPLTTKGDLLGFSTLNARVPVGTDGQFLRANSAVALGVSWQTVTTSDISEGSNLYFTNSRALTAIEKTNNATGFQIAGGTSSKTLIVSENSTIDQNLSSISNVAFNRLALAETLTVTNITTPTTPVGSGRYYSKLVSGNSRPFFISSSGVEYDLSDSGVTYTASNGVQLVVNDFQLDPTYSPTFTNLTLTGSVLDSAGSMTISSGGQLSLTAAAQIIHNGVTTFNDQLYVANSEVNIAGSGNPRFSLRWNNANNKMVIDSLDGIGGSRPLAINTFGGFTGFGFPVATTVQSILSVNGDVYYSNISTPSTPTLGGKAYVKDVSGVSHYFYIDTDGIEYQLSGAASDVLWSRTSGNLYPANLSDNVGIGTSTPGTNKLQVDGDLMVLTGTLRVSGGTALISQDGTAPQLTLRGSTNTDRKLELGIDTTNQVGFLQAYGAGPTPVELKLNPVNGNVSVGLAADLAAGSKFTISSDADAVVPQLLIQGNTTATKQLQLGYDTSSGNGFGYIQAVNQSVTTTPLKLNPYGGEIVLGDSAADPLGIMTIRMTNSFKLPGDMNVWDLSPTRSGPTSVLWRLKSDDNFVYTFTMNFV